MAHVKDHESALIFAGLKLDLLRIPGRFSKTLRFRGKSGPNSKYSGSCTSGDPWWLLKEQHQYSYVCRSNLPSAGLVVTTRMLTQSSFVPTDICSGLNRTWICYVKSSEKIHLLIIWNRELDSDVVLAWPLTYAGNNELDMKWIEHLHGHCHRQHYYY